MASLNEVFIHFSEQLNQIAEIEGEKVVRDWEHTLKTGGLTQYIDRTFFQIGVDHNILNLHRDRFTTIQPSLYEIFLGTLIKTIIETKMRDEAVEVKLDAYLRLNGRKRYPDVLIQQKGEPIGIIELKHSLKKNPYEKTERQRRADFLAQIPSLKTYSMIVYAIYDRSVLASIVNDAADWIQIIQYNEQAGAYRDTLKEPFVHRINPVELALNEIMNS